MPEKAITIYLAITRRNPSARSLILVKHLNLEVIGLP